MPALRESLTRPDSYHFNVCIIELFYSRLPASASIWALVPLSPEEDIQPVLPHIVFFNLIQANPTLLRRFPTGACRAWTAPPQVLG
jgi:hypothetical protein